MSSVLDAVKSRRSIRSFRNEEVLEYALRKILEAVRYSPSWANSQCWEIVVVKEGAGRDELKRTLAKGNPSVDAIVSAPVVLGICGKIGHSGFYKGSAATKFGD